MSTYKSLTEFYPTPPELVAEMIKGIKLTDIESVLEPSAGKGDIADFICYMRYCVSHRMGSYRYKDPIFEEYVAYKITYEEMIYKYMTTQWIADYNKRKYSQDEDERRYLIGDIREGCEKLDVNCIEVDDGLRAILKDKDYTVIGSDFLEFNGDEHFDLIIMNPPFSNGDEHLLHAINVAKKTGGKIICLLNRQTLDNPYSNWRKELKKQLDFYNAEIEYVSGAFKQAERQTDVECAIVRIDIPSPFNNAHSTILDELEEMEITVDEPDYNTSEIVTADYMRQAVLMYKKEIAMGKRLYEEYLAVSPHISLYFASDEKELPSYKRGAHIGLVDGRGKAFEWNKYVYSVRYKYWYELLHKPAFIGNLTSNLKEQYFADIKEYAKKDFSLSNIYAVRIDMLKSVAQGIEDKIISLFEKLTYKHSMEASGNVHYFSGWKSNSAFIINPRVVVPWCRCWDSIWGKFKYNFYDGEIGRILDDIEKCFDFLDGGENEIQRDLHHWLEAYEKTQTTKNLHFKYFDVNVYKKGTVHIKFTDLDVLKKFNIYGCMKKGWLPPSYGKKTYKAMDEEERRVIDEFEGEESYNQTFAQRERFIVSPESKVLMLEETVA